jgi:shikimate kinase
MTETQRRFPALCHDERSETTLSAWENHGTLRPPERGPAAAHPAISRKQMSLRLAERNKELKQERLARIREALGAKSIVLIGLMGAGKTAVGRRLAKRLELPFIDADTEIEIAAGQTVSEIFAEHGEPYFRQGEARVIARLLQDGPRVLATGGGAFMDAGTRAKIKASGISVWLKADLDVLLNRVRRRDNRPLLACGDAETVMRELMQQRYPIYAEADITVESREVAHETIVSDVVEALARWQSREPIEAAASSRDKVP